MNTNRKMLDLIQQAGNSLQLYRFRAASPKSRRVQGEKTEQTHSRDCNASETRNPGASRAIWQPKPGLRKPSRQPRFFKRSYSNEAGARDYMLFVPSSYAGQPLPLIVMLHGCKQSPRGFAAGTRMNQLAEENQCLVAYPAQVSSANGFRCWNWFKAGDQQRDKGEPSIIAGITTQILTDYCVDPRQVYIAGLSAGGSMAVIMGHTYPELYAAVGVHSGLPYGGARDVYSALLAMRRGTQPGFRPMEWSDEASDSACTIPAIVFHGDMDTTVHPGNSDQVIAQSAPNSTSGVPPAEIGIIIRHGQIEHGHAYTQTIYHDGAGDAVAEQWLVHGAGHSWSGGDAAGSFTDPQGPDASKEMLRFFLSHPHSGS